MQGWPKLTSIIISSDYIRFPLIYDSLESEWRIHSTVGFAVDRRMKFTDLWGIDKWHFCFTNNLILARFFSTESSSNNQRSGKKINCHLFEGKGSPIINWDIPGGSGSFCHFQGVNINYAFQSTRNTWIKSVNVSTIYISAWMLSQIDNKCFDGGIQVYQSPSPSKLRLICYCQSGRSCEITYWNNWHSLERCLLDHAVHFYSRKKTPAQSNHHPEVDPNFSTVEFFENLPS